MNIATMMITSNAMSAFGVALAAPTLIKVQGEMFMTSELSLLLLAPAFLRVLQALIKKVPQHVAMVLPVALDILWPLSIAVAWISLRAFIMVEVVMGGVFGLLYYNRGFLIIEAIKTEMNTAAFYSNNVTATAATSLLGLGASHLISEYLSPLEVISLSIMINTAAVPFVLAVNVRVKNRMLASGG